MGVHALPIAHKPLQSDGRIEVGPSIHGPIEDAISRLPGIASAVLIERESGGPRPRIVVHVVESGPAAVSLKEIRSALAADFPSSMLPTFVHRHAVLPRLSDGSIDLERLPGVPAWNADEYLPIMRAMADIASARLGIGDIGPDEDFFDLGGTDRSAMALAKRLEKAIGRPVSPAMVFHAPTPRMMSDALEGERQAEAGHFVDLKPDGDEPPMFCMPDVYGRPMSFISLAGLMPRSQPVIGLAVGPAAGDLVARRSMDSIATAYVDAILERRPAGPYRIVGYSFGGNFAQEVARRLHDMGRDTSLVLIDAPNRVVRAKPLLIASWAIRAGWRSLTSEGVRKAAWRSARRCKHLVSYLTGPGEVTIPKWVPSSDRQVADAHAFAWRTHRPLPFRGPALMVTCTHQDAINVFRNVDGMLGWSGLLAGRVDRHVADVVHQDVVRTGYGPILAAEMARFHATCFADARDGRPA